MVKRKALSKKLRFTIFDRDNFTCQYCGQNPETHKVVLEIDHLISVIDGGDNSKENLITSCFDCNRGKGRKSIIKTNKKDLSSDLEFSKKRLEQVKEIVSIKSKQRRLKRNAINKKIKEVEVLFYDYFEDWDFYDNVLADIKVFAKQRISKVPFDIFIESLDIAFNKFHQDGYLNLTNLKKYTCGIIRNKLND